MGNLSKRLDDFIEDNQIYSARLCRIVDEVEELEQQINLLSIHGYAPEELHKVFKDLQDENKRLREALEFYAYPKHEDGDRAYIFGHEAREALRKIDEK